MREVPHGCGLGTSVPSGTNVVTNRTLEKYDKSVGDDEDWFSQATRTLYNGKAGTVLSLETGFDERSCQRYAAGSVKPPAYFLRRLLRSERGWTWLCAVMDGCNVEWWADVRRGKRMVEVTRGV